MRGSRSALTLCLFLLAAPEALAQVPGVWAGAGTNTTGAIGSGNFNASAPSPELLVTTGVLNGKTLIEVSAGFNHTCALTDEGIVYCWGQNGKGQLGNGTDGNGTHSNVPVAVNDGTNDGSLAGKTVRQVRAGYLSTCAVATDLTAHCWGSNDSAQLGNIPASFNSQTLSNVPVVVRTANSPSVTPLAGVTFIGISDGHACAVASGTLYCWGRNGAGQLGSGNTTDSSTPTAVSTTCTNGSVGAAAANSVAANGIYSRVSLGRGNTQSNGLTCALTSTGVAHCWGYNASGELGLGAGSPTSVPCPSAVSTASGTSSLSGKTLSRVVLGAGNNASIACALATDGTAHCWGNRSSGRLGDGLAADNTNIFAPRAVALPAGVRLNNVSIGVDHVCSVSEDGRSYCWGGNAASEFGTGTANATNISPVVAGTGGTVLADTAFSNVSTGNDFTLWAAPAGGAGMEFKPGLWQMLSLPCSPTTAVTATPENLFGTNSPAGFDNGCYGNNSGACAGKGWLISKYTKSNSLATGSYTTVGQAETMDFATGAGGYWIKSYAAPLQPRLYIRCNTANAKPNPPFTQGNFGATTCLSSRGCFSIPVTTAWSGNTYNLVPNPLPYAIDWSRVRVCVGGTDPTCTAVYSPCQAAGLTVAQGCTGPAAGPASPPLISNRISIYNGNAYNEYTDFGATLGNLGYFQSFWVNVLAGAQGQSVRLIIPATPSTNPVVSVGSLPVQKTATVSSSQRTAAAASKPKAQNAWSVKLSVFDFARGMSHENTFIGRQAGALNGYDPQDLPRTPPLEAPYLYAAINSTSWGARNGEYASDFREPKKQSGTSNWQFVIKTDTAGGTVRLKWEASSSTVLRTCALIGPDGRRYAANNPALMSNGLDVVMTQPAMTFTWRCANI